MQGLLLAAGQSRRFGADKRFALFDGRPMALACALAMREALGDVLAVLRAQDDALAQDLARHGIAVTHCPDAALGMGHSLAHGVRETAHARGWVVGLADMPAVQPATIRAVAEAVMAGCIAVPVLAGRRGHPVGFDSSYFSALSVLRGDTGARSVVQAHAARVREVQTEDSGVLLDIDTLRAP